MAHSLAAFIEETGDSVAGFARRVGVAGEVLEAIISDEATPEPMLARRIAEATSGAVSFDQLMSGRRSIVADLSGRRAVETSIDLSRLSEAIALTVTSAFPASHVPRGDFDIAAEAVAHTYAALARVTTARGAARLVQALRPVLEEILRDRGGLPRDLQALDAAALAATERYHRI